MADASTSPGDAPASRVFRSILPRPAAHRKARPPNEPTTPTGAELEHAGVAGPGEAVEQDAVADHVAGHDAIPPAASSARAHQRNKNARFAVVIESSMVFSSRTAIPRA